MQINQKLTYIRYNRSWEKFLHNRVIFDPSFINIGDKVEFIDSIGSEHKGRIVQINKHFSNRFYIEEETNNCAAFKKVGIQPHFYKTLKVNGVDKQPSYIVVPKKKRKLKKKECLTC